MTGKATRLNLLSWSSVQMRVFHLSWMAFFVCFFAWFAVAPLMPLIRDDLHLSKEQLANINIAAVFVTIIVRLLIGPLCDRFGARRTYTWLLALGALPVLGIGLSQSYAAFLFFRLCIGAIGASFVITQFHTSTMFAPNVVGTANATGAGWGNSGGGAAQALMPLIVMALLSFGVEKSLSWRVAMLVPGVLMLIMAVLYYRYADDTPEGRITGSTATFRGNKPSGWQTFKNAARDYRVWMLFATYSACFGVELTIHNLAAVYYVDRFGLDMKTAGLYVGAFGLMALFARALGGLISDRVAHVRGLDGRTAILFVFLFLEGVGLVGFAQMDTASKALLSMLMFGFFTHLACGATYALVPFINRNALGGVAGIVGAGGNVGAVAAGFLMKSVLTTQQGLLLMGIFVIVVSFCALTLRFSREHKDDERKLYLDALATRGMAAATRSANVGA